jgi:SNF2 family DNA or RNA helicase
MTYQLEPLRKALRLPRVNLFIADDVGLGKTIEAGLILREMIMRQKVKRIVIACPASVISQWQTEMEVRFGLSFVILDRDYVIRCRRERGYGSIRGKHTPGSSSPTRSYATSSTANLCAIGFKKASPVRCWFSTRRITRHPRPQHGTQ